ncbi:MAG: hypothetical protein RL322_166 [Pseudomonadota bacterium]
MPSATGTAARSRRPAGLGPAAIQRWFTQKGWTPQPFQRRVWRAMAAGSSGLVHAGTGSGKTLAVWFGALLRARPGAGLQVLWVTPMRALATDTRAALEATLAELGLPVGVALRSSDTSTAERARQLRSPPFAWVTTPESLSLLLARPEAEALFAGLSTIIVDEWHELIGSKRGVQVQLALARLRRWARAPVVWGLSATLAEPADALAVLVTPDDGVVVSAPSRRPIRVDTLIPDAVGRLPWAGHLGARMLDPVVREVESSASTLIFCNTRAQAEIWYQMLLERRPDWAGLIALHHGSLDLSVRSWVEDNMRAGRLRAVVCTSTLDLGVDFSPVERVLQVGSAKGLARLMQRAGRSGHQPGGVSRVTLVPTHALELLEAAAARRALAARRLEPHRTLNKPLDVLVQHLVTVALGSGFQEEALRAEVRSTHAYRTLSDDEWSWAMDFVVRGGDSLVAYPDYRKLVLDSGGCWRVTDAAIARRHRQAIGTIVGESEVSVRSLTGARLGSVEESFVSRLKPGECFVFGGRVLELVRFRDLEAWVRTARASAAAVSRWVGSRMSLSSELAEAMLDCLAETGAAALREPELRALAPLLDLQGTRSQRPGRARLLIEVMRSREGHHLFAYPFAGRAAHLGLAPLLAWRMSKRAASTWSISVNDYGFELFGPAPFDLERVRSGELFAPAGLDEDLEQAVNAAELVKRRFRENARIAGLLLQGGPGARRSNRSLQASAGLFYEVFARHDPNNRLLAQARREVLDRELERPRIHAVLDSLSSRPIEVVEIDRATPFAFPLMVDRLRERLSTEQLDARIARLIAQAERGS